MPRALNRTATAALLCLVLAGCGSRLDGSEILAASSEGSTVRLSEDSIAALRDDASNAAPTAPIAPDATTSDPAAAPAATRDSAPTRGQKANTIATVRPAQGAPTGGVRTATAPKAAASCPPGLATINIGHVGLFSGIAGPITGSAPATMAAWASDVNARGGLACHPVKVFTRDDGGDPNRSAAIVNDLVRRQGVVAFVASQTVLSAAGFVPAVKAARIPVVGGVPVNDTWFADPLFFPDGASPVDQVIGMLKHGVERGKSKVGIIYCVEAPACTSLVKLIRDKAAEPAGVTVVYDAPVSITQPDFTAQCLNAQKAGVDQLVLAVDGASMTRIARSCKSVNYRPLLSTVASAIGNGQAEDATLRSFGVVTANTTVPWTQNDRPGLREYHRALARWAPQLEADGASISAWAAAKMFEAALTNVADEARTASVTTSVLLDGLGRIRKDTLGGLLTPLSFAAGQKHATSTGCVFYQMLTAQGWTAPRGSTPVCLRR